MTAARAMGKIPLRLFRSVEEVSITISSIPAPIPFPVSQNCSSLAVVWVEVRSGRQSEEENARHQIGDWGNEGEERRCTNESFSHNSAPCELSSVILPHTDVRRCSPWWVLEWLSGKGASSEIRGHSGWCSFQIPMLRPVPYGFCSSDCFFPQIEELFRIFAGCWSTLNFGVKVSGGACSILKFQVGLVLWPVSVAHLFLNWWLFSKSFEFL